VSQLEFGPLTQSEGEVGQKGIGATSWSACTKNINLNTTIELNVAVKLLLIASCNIYIYIYGRVETCYNSAYSGK
jgi:hypothetical protein